MMIKILLWKFVELLEETKANLFAADLYNMYLRYAEKQGWKVEVVDRNETEVGGFKKLP